MYVYSVRCVYLLLILQYVKGYEGDFCTLKRTDENGQCKLISTCPSAIEDLKKRRLSPQTCGFSKTEPIVCCVGSSAISPPLSPTPTPTPRITTTTTTTTTEAPKLVDRNLLSVGDRSLQKCQEYEQYVYSRSPAVGVLGSSNTPDSDDCGIGGVENVVSGKRAKPKEFPHMALIGYRGLNNQKKWECGGSLISEKFVLTAAHCLNIKNYGAPKYVRLGELILNSVFDDAEPQDFDVINKFQPPNYIPPSQHNDIALLELHKEAELNSYVRPACLNLNPNPDNRLAIAAGFGQTGDGERASSALLKVTLEMFTIEECNDVYSSGILHETQICAGSHNDSRDTCYGDSGGPLQLVSSRAYCSYDLIGVTSFGITCGLATVPGVYTRVSAYIKWIEDIVWP